jgi:hypothetical protein
MSRRNRINLRRRDDNEIRKEARAAAANQKPDAAPAAPKPPRQRKPAAPKTTTKGKTK